MDESMLTYMITAHDLASPVFRSFSAQVDAMSRSVQASLKELQAQLAETQKQMTALGATADANTAKTDAVASSSGDAAAASAVLGASHTNLSKAVDSTTDSLGEHTDQLGSATAGAASLAAQASKTASSEAELKTAIDDTNKSLDDRAQKLADAVALATSVNAGSVEVTDGESKVKLALRDTTEEVDKHKEAWEALIPTAGLAGEKFESVQNKLSMLRTHGIDYAAAGILGLETAFAGAGVKSAIEFDNMNKEIQAQTGVTQSQAAKLVAVAQQIGSKVPVAFSEIGTAVGAEYDLFGKNLNLIQANTDGMLAFANQAGTGTQQTIQQLAAVMRNFKPAGENVVDVMDDLTRLSQKSQVPLGTYMQLLSRFGPTLQAMGISFKESTGLFDSFSQHGVTVTQMARGMQSGLSFATKAIKEQESELEYEGKGGMDPYTKAVLSAKLALEQLQTSTAAGSMTQQEYDQKLRVANLTMKDATDKWLANKQIIDIVAKAHGNVGTILQDESVKIADAKTKADAMNLSLEVFGNRLGPQMEKVLYRQQDGLAGLKDKLTDTKGAIEQLAASERDTMEGQMKILENQFTVISSTVGKDMLPALKDGAAIFHTLGVGVQEFSTGSTAGIAKVTAGVLGLGSALLLLTRHVGVFTSIAKAATPDGSFAQNLLAGKNATTPEEQVAKHQLEQIKSGAGITSGGASNLVGWEGNSTLVGSQQNPLAVQIVGEGIGGPGEDDDTSPANTATESAASREDTPASVGAATETRPSPALVDSERQAAVTDAASAQPTRAAASASPAAVEPLATESPATEATPLAERSPAAARRPATSGGRESSLASEAESIPSPASSDSPALLASSADKEAEAKALAAREAEAKNLAERTATSTAEESTAGLLEEGGAGALVLGGAAHTSPATEARALAGESDSSGLLSTVKSALPGMEDVMRGGMVAFGGAMAAKLLAGLVGGSTGKSLGKVGEDTAVGAGIGTAIEPGIGTAVGAAGGALVSLLGGTGNNVAAADMKALDAAIKDATGSDNIAQIQALEGEAEKLAKSFGDTSTSGTAFKDLADKLHAAIPQLGADAADAANGFSGPLQTALTQIAGQYGFPAVTKAINDTSDDVTQKTALVVKALTNIVDTGSAPMAKNAKAALDTLKDAVADDTANASDSVVKNIGSMKTQITDGSATAAAQAQANFQKFAQAVETNMTAGVTSTSQGVQQIVGTLDEALSALGKKPISLKQASALTSALNSGAEVAVPGLASGGRVPGPVGPDTWTLLDPNGVPAAAVGGGELLVANRHTEAKVNSMLPAGVTLGGLVAGETVPHSATPHMATGGAIPTPTVAGGGVLGTLVSAALADIASAASSRLTGEASSPTGKAASAGGGAGAGAGSLTNLIPTGEHQSLIRQALKAAGVQDTTSNEAAVNLIIEHESSWNADAVNKSDINWQEGHPSVGLMQVIAGTFAEYVPSNLDSAGPIAYGVSENPVANMAAGIRYGVSRYGSLESVPGVVAVSQGGSYVGYARGGRIGRAEYAGAFAKGGSFVASKPTIGLFGEGGVPERVTAVPAYATGGGLSAASLEAAGYSPADAKSLLSGLTKAQNSTPNVAMPATSLSAEQTASRINPITGAKMQDTSTEYTALTQKYQALTGALTKVTGDTAQFDAVLQKFGLSRAEKGSDSGMSAGLITAIQSAFTKSLAQDTVPQLKDIAASLKGKPGSRPFEMQTAALTAESTKLAANVSTTQAQATHRQTIQNLVDAMPKGTKAATLGLTPTELAASGIAVTSKGVLAGAGQITAAGGTSAAAYQQQATDAKEEQDTLKTEGAKTATLYNAALKDHQKKLAASLKTQLDTITQARLTADQDVTTDQVDAIDAAAQAASTAITSATTNSGIASSLQGLDAGSNTGISQSVLNTLGIGGASAGQTGVAAANAENGPLTSALGTATSALNSLEGQVQSGSLTGSALTEATSQIATLSSSIVQLDGTINQNLITAINNQVQATTDTVTQDTTASSLATSIEGLSPGTNTGISSAVLSTLGIGGVTAGDNSVSGANAANAPLQQALQAATSTMNSLEGQVGTLSGSALTDATNQIASLAGTIVNLQSTIQSNLITALNNAATAAAQPGQDSSDVVTAIEALAPGSNLGALGFTNQELSQYGLTTASATALEGTAGTYTGALAVNQGLQAELTADQGSLSTDESEYNDPSSALYQNSTLESTITSLIKTMLGLDSTIRQNTQATTANTNASTTSTGQMTGSVGYSYNSQNYVVGGMSSDSPSNVAVGL